MTSRREQAYDAMLTKLTLSVGRLTDAEAARVLALLEDSLERIDETIAATEWQAYRIPQLKESVERAISSFTQQYQAGFSDATKNIWLAGIDAVDAPLAAAGLLSSTSELNREALQILQGYSADLIGGLSSEALKRINNEITMGILGEKNAWEVMQAIGRNLHDKGVMQSIAARAEAITRTEMARVHSAAREARMHDAVDADPEAPWMKKWISSGKAYPRQNHAALDGKMVPVGENFPGGFPYPHAPGLPAKEVVNCGCTHVLARKDWGDLPKKWTPTPSALRANYN